jgi:hypothetical protein
MRNVDKGWWYLTDVVYLKSKLIHSTFSGVISGHLNTKICIIFLHT